MKHFETKHLFARRAEMLRKFSGNSRVLLSRAHAFGAYGVTHSVDENSSDKLDLAKLRTHAREKPRTKAGQVRQAWPDIKQLLDAGHSLKDVCHWLNEIGLQIGYARLSDYVCQLRRKEAVLAHIDAPLRSNPTLTEEAALHPLAQILEREKRHTGFDYNAEPDPKKLI